MFKFIRKDTVYRSIQNLKLYALTSTGIVLLVLMKKIFWILDGFQFFSVPVSFFVFPLFVISLLIVSGIFSMFAYKARDYEDGVKKMEDYLKPAKIDYENIVKLLGLSNEELEKSVKKVYMLFELEKSISSQEQDAICVNVSVEVLKSSVDIVAVRKGLEGMLKESKITVENLERNKIKKPKSYTFWKKAFAFPEEQEVTNC